MTDEAPPARLEAPPWMEDPGARRVLECLDEAGGMPRVVGGAVRDATAGRSVGEVDIATPLTPETVTTALEAAGIRAVPTGIDHGTVTAVVDGQGYEVTTLREDVETDGRHAVVRFTDDFTKDAARRDFTINALSCDLHGLVHDYFGGLDDLAAGRVRFVGDPARRIREDYLRILRFFRFHALFGRHDPDPAALAACRDGRDGLTRLAAERVRAEVTRLLAATDPVPAWRAMGATGVRAVILPEAGNTGRLAGLIETEGHWSITPDWLRRFGAVLDGSADRLIAVTLEALAERLRFSNGELARLVAMAPPLPEAVRKGDPAAVRRVLYTDGAEAVRDRLCLTLAGASAAGVESPRDGAIGEAAFSVAWHLADRWVAPTLPVTGKDVLALGVEPGPEVGRYLKAVEAWWIDEDFVPGREACLARLSGLVTND